MICVSCGGSLSDRHGVVITNETLAVAEECTGTN